MNSVIQTTRVKTGWIIALLLTILTVIILDGIVLHLNFKKVSEQEDWVRHTYEVIEQLDLTRSEILAGNVNFLAYEKNRDSRILQSLQTHEEAVQNHLRSVQALTSDNGVQQAYVEQLHQYVQTRQADLDQAKLKGSTALFSGQSLEQSLASLNKTIEDMKAVEIHLLHWRSKNSTESKAIFLWVLILTTATTLLIILFAFHLVRNNQLRSLRDAHKRVEEAEDANMISSTAELLVGEISLEEASTRLVRFLSERLGIMATRIYLVEKGELKSIAHPDEKTPSLVADAARRSQPWEINQVPKDYWHIETGLGSSLPHSLLFLPLHFQGEPVGIVEAASLEKLKPRAIALLAKIADSISVALNSARSRRDLQRLLETTQLQSEELQTQQEELKVNNEELEEQANALRESQVNLEQQQHELEQTNSRLQEQAKILENQKEDLERKSKDLQSVSKYKSEFLANMSHELRTPLNSSLILARLLAENADGNLTPQQVKYADTIRSSGMDLLNLINDILDLAKVEAGKLEISLEPISISSLMKSMEQTFSPIAGEKKLHFHCKVYPGSPDQVSTDRQRLEQILRNLLSNAFKFTEKGEVVLSLEAVGSGVVFSVTDTGLGIAREQQDVIFEAFRQVDGTNKRKFGGTGLGLSISRELASLLGGKIEVSSEPGKGSQFRFTLPLQATEMRRAVTSTEESYPNLSHAGLSDDRNELKAGGRTLLVIEDDSTFAKILYALAVEQGFQCLVASTGKEGLKLAHEFMPAGILLDVVLPDQAGTTILDRLKKDSKTRHIPVHVISAHDQPQSLLERGAVGFLQKPVDRAALLGAFQKLEEKLVQSIKRVLVVEDHPAQRDSIVALLTAPDTKIVSVESGQQALDTLEKSTFDCVVVDLSLPDMTGFELLAKLGQKTDIALPPVIVYTGRDLNRNEEEQLRRYSKSIIVKGARSPERLLDDVSLFVHRLETTLPPEKQRMLKEVRSRDEVLEGKKVLVVDDDARNIFALLGLLEAKGLVVTVARNGREALEKLAADPSLQSVLMDIMMPEMDGYETMREIRKQERFSQLPIIAITAKAMASDYTRCMDAGANDYLAKPVDSEKLVSLLRVWMSRA